MPRNPTVLAPRTVKVPPGVKVRMDVGPTPLFKVIPVVCFRLVVLPPFRVNAAAEAPVKTMPAPARLVLVLKLIVPLLVRSCPTVSTCVVMIPLVADRKVPFVETVTLCPTVRD